MEFQERKSTRAPKARASKKTEAGIAPLSPPDLARLYWRAAAEFLAESNRQRQIGNDELADRILKYSRGQRRIACAADPAQALQEATALEEAAAREDELNDSQRYGFHDCVSGKPLPVCEMEAPLPCPFCGSEDEGGIVDASDAEVPSFHVQCSSCLSEGPPAATAFEAALCWNERLGWRA